MNDNTIIKCVAIYEHYTTKIIPNKRFYVVNYISNFEIENFKKDLQCFCFGQPITNENLLSVEYKINEIIEKYRLRGSLMSEEFFNNYNLENYEYITSIINDEKRYLEISSSNKRIF